MAEIESWVLALEGTAVSASLRTSIWLYPIINALHIIGLGLLLGAATGLDLRLLGWRKQTSVSSLANTLLPIAALGLVVAIVTGTLLFIARPLDYVFNGLFLTKLGLLILALLNIAWCMRSAQWRAALHDESISSSLKISAALSLAFWLAIIFAGRMIGYR